MAAASVASASEVVDESRLQGWPRDQSRFPFFLSFAFQKKSPAARAWSARGFRRVSLCRQMLPNVHAVAGQGHIQRDLARHPAHRRRRRPQFAQGAQCRLRV